MKGRAYAIDLLRGLAIVGWSSRATSAGIRASGMAFPCAGPASGLHVRPFAAGHHVGGPGLSLLPLLDGRGVPVLARTEAGPGRAAAAIVGGILRRGVLLAFFAVALGNLSMWRLNEVLPQPALRALLTLAVMGGYFALFIRLPALSKGRNDLLNACGAVWLVAMMLLYRRLGVRFRSSGRISSSWCWPMSWSPGRLSGGRRAAVRWRGWASWRCSWR